MSWSPLCVSICTSCHSVNLVVDDFFFFFFGANCSARWCWKVDHYFSGEPVWWLVAYPYVLSVHPFHPLGSPVWCSMRIIQHWQAVASQMSLIYGSRNKHTSACGFSFYDLWLFLKHHLNIWWAQVTSIINPTTTNTMTEDLTFKFVY